MEYVWPNGALSDTQSTGYYWERSNTTWPWPSHREAVLQEVVHPSGLWMPGDCIETNVNVAVILALLAYGQELQAQ